MAGNRHAGDHAVGGKRLAQERLVVSLFVAIADRSRFNQLSAEKPVEVNFWQLSRAKLFRAVSPGELVLFQTAGAPGADIVGGGVFSQASNVPLLIA